MAYTFLKAMGHPIGTSICERGQGGARQGNDGKCQGKNGVKFLLPLDNVVATEYKADTESMTVPSDDNPRWLDGTGYRPQDHRILHQRHQGAGTVVWNGPMGVSEWENFAAGTIGVAKAVAEVALFPSSAAAIPLQLWKSWVCRQDDPYFYRRRRVSGIPGGPGLPGIACLNEK